ncbi:MAG: hypothetical protein KME20_18975 [Kaiparowitsia implicata GSE-PSE-MK54-09C]|jgi:uncharacterized coiled-coil protein SlyX|nr:hypothetical protein [Kaiparowitsia implicata GSE-PSE-MK54-09C]
MDSLQGQIENLNAKIDAVRNQIEQLTEKMTSSPLNSTASIRDDRSYGNSSSIRYGSAHRSAMDADMEHKDIIADSGLVDSNSQSGEHSLSPELQVQRLTAQLTAAYNRIAALEEQLLSKRIHH